MAKPPDVRGPARDLLAERFDKHAEEIYRLYRAGIRATQRYQLKCPHCGAKHEHRVKDLDAARLWAVAWREIRFGRPAQASAPTKARPKGATLESLSMEELYALAYPDEDSPELAEAEALEVNGLVGEDEEETEISVTDTAGGGP